MIKTCSRDSPLPNIEYIKSSPGMFHDTVVHDIDLTIWIATEYPTSVFCYANAFRKEYAEAGDVDTISVTMKFPSGALGQIDLSRFASYGYDQRIEVFGDLGMIESLNHNNTCIRKSNIKGLCKDMIEFNFSQRYANAYKSELDHFVEMVLKGTKPLVTKEQVLAVSTVASACEESHRIGKAMTLDYEKMTFSPIL